MKKFAILLAFVVLTVMYHRVDFGINDITNFVTAIAEYISENLVAEPEPREHTAWLALVAHAGGAVAGFENSNSLEAIESASARNFRYIELDMILSSDGIVVLNHSWHTIADRVPGVPNEIMTYTEFMDQKIFNRFTPANLDMLIEFLRQNPEPRIITDTKETDYAALYAIAYFFPEYRHRFIPQVYAFGDAQRMRALGFEDIILTVYMMTQAEQDAEQIHNYAIEHELYAVTIPDELTEVFLEGQTRAGEMRYMVHTTDNVARALELQTLGVYAVYTGFLEYTNDLADIVYVPLPVTSYLNKLSANAQRLSEHQQNIFNTAMFYKIDIPAYAHMGSIEPIWSEYWVSAPFIHPTTGHAYLVDRNFANYADSREFNAYNYMLNIVRNGYTYTVDSVMYRGMVFISEETVKTIFGFDVLRRGQYIIVAPYGSIHSQDELFEIASILFADVLR